jgi:NAD(P)-dependent dehydrogenase (short-subunit alcohol dehydrogenase family)
MPDARKIALVTGANRGIGREIVRRLASQGITTILAARDAAKAETAAAEFATQGLPVVGRQLDVTDPASINRLAKSIADEFGKLDILVNNAGIYLDGERNALTTDLEAVRQTFETNVFGAWQMAQAFAPLLRKSGHGRIVNLSSQMGQLGSMTDGTPGYRASKAALNAVTRMLADTLKADGVLVNSVCPGWVKTDMGGPNAPGTVEQGADTPVWAAMLPDGGPTGRFFQGRKEIAW